MEKRFFCGRIWRGGGGWTGLPRPFLLTCSPPPPEAHRRPVSRLSHVTTAISRRKGDGPPPSSVLSGWRRKVFWYLEKVDNLFSGVKCARPLLTTSLPLSTPATRPPHPIHARSCPRVPLIHEQALHAQGTWRLLCRASEACRPRRTQLVR